MFSFVRRLIEGSLPCRAHKTEFGGCPASLVGRGWGRASQKTTRFETALGQATRLFFEEDAGRVGKRQFFFVMVASAARMSLELH